MTRQLQNNWNFFFERIQDAKYLTICEHWETELKDKLNFFDDF